MLVLPVGAAAGVRVELTADIFVSAGAAGAFVGFAAPGEIVDGVGDREPAEDIAVDEFEAGGFGEWRRQGGDGGGRVSGGDGRGG